MISCLLASPVFFLGHTSSSPLPEVWSPKPGLQHPVSICPGEHADAHLRLEGSVQLSSLCRIFFLLPSTHLLLPSPLRYKDVSLSLLRRGFPSMQKCFLLHNALQDVQVPSRFLCFSNFCLFVLFSPLIILPYSFMWRLTCFFGSWKPLPAFSGYPEGVVLHTEVFWCICGEKGDLHVFFHCHISWISYILF